MKMPSVSQLVAFAVSLVALAACGDGIKGGKAPTLDIKDGTRAITRDSVVEVSAAGPKGLIIANNGNADLTVESLEVVSSVAGAFEAVTVATPFVVSAGDHESLTLYYHSELGANATAVVHVRAKNMADFTFNLQPVAATGALVANPGTLDFKVHAQQVGTKALQLANTGSAAVTVTRFYFSGHTGFGLTIGDTTYAVTAESASTGVTLPEPIVLQALSSIDLTVSYRADGEEGAEGEIKFISDDPSSADGTVVELFANVDAPCLKVSPQVVDFGGKPVGHAATIPVLIQSCGDRPLVVDDIAITDDAGGLFSIDAAALTGGPITIQPNSDITIDATYLPTEIAALDGANPVRDEGTMTVYSDAVVEELAVKLTGFGVDPSCPVATITCTQQEEVAVQSTIQCSARESSSATGITRYQWSVQAPDGSTSTIRPATDSRDINFQPNLVGSYTFTLKVWDSFGTQSCADATQTFFATADGGIHVELLWHTPSDLDESDEGIGAGTDIDLHFMDPRSSGWFDAFYDANWLNTNPDWGQAGNDLDDPSLDRDDTDGAGPENMNVEQPPSGTCYEIGAHYWDDWSYGFSLATVRVYIYGELRFHWDDVRMKMLDLWEVGSVCWPSGEVTAHGGTTPQILQNVDPSASSCDGICGTTDDEYDIECFINDCF